MPGCASYITHVPKAATAAAAAQRRAVPLTIAPVTGLFTSFSTFMEDSIGQVVFHVKYFVAESSASCETVIDHYIVVRATNR